MPQEKQIEINTGAPRPGWVFFLTLVAASLIGPLAINLYLPALPAVKAALAVPEALVGLTYSVALLVMAAATLVYGSLSDRFGRRPLLLGGLLLFVVGSALAASADTLATLMLARIIQALGAASGVTLARTIARDAYGAEGLVKVLAYLTMAYAMGPMLSTLGGGILVDLSGWRSIFAFAAMAGILIAGAAYLVLRETRPEAEAPQRQQGMLKGYLALFSHARFLGFVLQTGCSSGVYYALAAAAAFLMKDHLGRSASEFGIYFALFPIGYLLGSLASSKISPHWPIENMVLAGSVISFVAIALQSLTILAGFLSPLILFLPGFFLTFGQGLALPNAQVGAMRVIPRLAGTAAGVGVFCQLFFGALFAQIYTLFADGTPLPMVATVAAGSLATLAAGMVPYVWRRRQARPEQQPVEKPRPEPLVGGAPGCRRLK